MKSTKVYYILFFMIILTTALFCVNLLKKQNIKNEEYYKQKEEKNIIEFKADEEIRVKMHETGEIIAMDINDYLRGVLPAEMSPKYDIEALKAQAIVARTYTYKQIQNKKEGIDADICDNYAHCQAFYNKDKIYEIWKNKGYTMDEIFEYWDKINNAVVDTQGMVITYNNEIINAYFHASSPIKTEDISQIWGCESFPYLISVDNKEDESYENRYSEVCVSYDELVNKINEDNNINGFIKKEEVPSICINEYTISGRVKNIKINKVIISAEKLRGLLGLKSTNFSISVDDLNSIVKFSVIGYGHGVGLSQVGADTYARNGMNYEQIIKHYYTGVEIKTLK